MIHVCDIAAGAMMSAEEAVEEWLKREGYVFFRLEYPWGRTPTYKRFSDGAMLYRDGTKLLTWQEMKAVLRETWRPHSREDQDWFCANL